MRMSKFCCLLAILLPISALAQVSVVAQGPGGPPQLDGGPEVRTGGVVIRREMGEWWRDSKLAKKLQLSDEQISKLNQIFFDHRIKLIDYGATMEKEDLKLQNFLDADDPNEGQVGTQVDQVLAARGKLEREYTMMNLDLRKVLSVAQWRQLKSIREERGPGGNVFFYKQMGPGAPSPPLPPPGPDGENMF